MQDGPERSSPAGEAEALPSRWHAALGWLRRNGPDLGTNALAGAVASLLTIAYCLSFSALLFQGELRDGLAAGLWSLLVGSAIAGIYISLTTTLPPVEAGPDNPAVAVLSVLAGTVSSQVFANGGSAALAIDHVLLSFSLATLVTGLVLYGLGVLKLGQIIRFVPYPVIGGFLAASGWFLLTGGIEVVTGHDFSPTDLPGSIPSAAMPQVLLGLAFAGGVYALKARTGSMYVLPLAFVAGSLLLGVILHVMRPGGNPADWYIMGTSHLEPWVPMRAAFASGIDWRVFLHAAAEIGAAAGVTVIALLLDVTGLEVARAKSADLDWEFRTNGAANILAAPFGGVMGNLSMNGSRLLDETGGLARMSGVFASLVVVLVVVTGLDLPGLVPKPILAGLLMYLGLVVLIEVLLRSPAHRAWTDFALALAIMGAIVMAGYLAGVVFGFVAACLMFAINYSRIAVIRRHLTRADYASNVDRAPEDARLLRESGHRVHVFWLSGFIFFGSSNRVFEGIRSAIEAEPDDRFSYAILDLQDVSGFDTSALLSLVKLRNYCEEHGVTLCFAGLSPGMRAAFEHAGLFGAGRSHKNFATRSDALAWCEDEVLTSGKSDTDAVVPEDFESWLAEELGSRDRARRMLPFFERRKLDKGRVLYRQGEPSDTIDFIVNGSVAVTVAGEPGPALLLRRMSKKTVVGEMGFFRSSARGASVTAEDGAEVYSLSRARYDSLLAEDPETGSAFLEFIVRTLADRLDFANQGIAALS